MGYLQVLGRRGYGYGPVFRGLRAAWRLGGEVFAEVRLPEGRAGDAGSFGVHPALLDAVLQAIGLAGLGAVGRRAGRCCRLRGRGCGWMAAGAAVLRVRMAPGDGGVRIRSAADEAGRLVVRVEPLVLRPVSAGSVAGGAGGGAAVVVRGGLGRVAVAAVAGGRWAVLAGGDAGPVVAGPVVAGLAGAG